MIRRLRSQGFSPGPECRPGATSKRDSSTAFTRPQEPREKQRRARTSLRMTATSTARPWGRGGWQTGSQVSLPGIACYAPTKKDRCRRLEVDDATTRSHRACSGGAATFWRRSGGRWGLLANGLLSYDSRNEVRSPTAQEGSGMERGYLSRKHYFFLALAVLTFMASVAVFILSFAIDRRGGSNGAVIAIIAAAGANIPIWVGVAVAIFAPMFGRKPSQAANYPRIEHLRIAGKYAPTGAAKIGVSPLHLR